MWIAIGSHKGHKLKASLNGEIWTWNAENSLVISWTLRIARWDGGFQLEKNK